MSSAIVSPGEMQVIEEALEEVLNYGYGSLEIIVERNQITGFKKRISVKFGKFKEIDRKTFV